MATSLIAAMPLILLGNTTIDGHYRFDNYQAMQNKDIEHSFYLNPDGSFKLWVKWLDYENSLATGEWSFNSPVLVLDGQISVKTQQGNWDIPFKRQFSVLTEGDSTILEPVKLKNRYGILGWPNNLIRH